MPMCWPGCLPARRAPILDELLPGAALELSEAFQSLKQGQAAVTPCAVAALPAMVSQRGCQEVDITPPFHWKLQVALVPNQGKKKDRNSIRPTNTPPPRTSNDWALTHTC